MLGKKIMTKKLMLNVEKKSAITDADIEINRTIMLLYYTSKLEFIRNLSETTAIHLQMNSYKIVAKRARAKRINEIMLKSNKKHLLRKLMNEASE